MRSVPVFQVRASRVSGRPSPLARSIREFALSQPPRNSSPRRVVRRDLDTHPVSLGQADMMHTQPAASLGKHRVSKRTGGALDGVKTPAATLDDCALKDKIISIARLGSIHPRMLAHFPAACGGALLAAPRSSWPRQTNSAWATASALARDPRGGGDASEMGCSPRSTSGAAALRAHASQGRKGGHRTRHRRFLDLHRRLWLRKSKS
jgi:hypothetical protein